MSRCVVPGVCDEAVCSPRARLLLLPNATRIRRHLTRAEKQPCRRWLRSRFFGRHCLDLLFCKPSSAHRSGSTTVPRGRQIVTIGDSSQEVNVQRSPKSRIAKTRNLTYRTSYQRKLSATRLTSMAHVVSIFIPAPQTNWTLPRHAITPYNSTEKKINPRNDALCSGHNIILQGNRPWKFKDNHIEMCGK